MKQNEKKCSTALKPSKTKNYEIEPKVMMTENEKLLITITDIKAFL